MRKFRIKSYRDDSHVIQRLYWGFLWMSPPGMDYRWCSYINAEEALIAHIKATTGYPRVSKLITEDEVWK